MIKFVFVFVSSFLMFFFAKEALMGDPTHILVVRHGETFRNAEGKEIQGWIDDAAAQLNEKGKEQADELGKKLLENYPNLSAIYSSPLKRSKDTATRIGKYFPSLSIIEDPRLKDICHGQFDTMSFQERNAMGIQRYKELEKEFAKEHPGKTPDRFFKWKFNPLSEMPIPKERINHPLEGDLETVYQLFTRASSAIKEIIEKHPGETVVVCSHAALIKTLATEAEYRERGDKGPLPVYYEPKAPNEPESRLLPGNCIVYHFVFKDGELFFLGTEDLEKFK